MKRLEWDSKFWNIDVYDFDKNDSLCSLDLIVKSNKKQYLVQSLVGIDELDTINKLEDNGFRYVETKFNFIKNRNVLIELNKDRFKDICLKEVLRYKNVFGDLYYNFSRYNMFKFEKVNDFYYLWVENSIKGILDDKCIGYYSDNQLSGFITYKIREKDLTIGLIGVLPKFQRKGIGQALLNYATNIATIKGCKNINVSTQGNNYNAINTYIKNGFVINNIQSWFYLRGGQND